MNLTRGRAEQWRLAWSVRRDWPDGSHEFVGIRRNRRSAERFQADDQAFWRRSPMVPKLTVVPISERDFVLHGRHRRGCRAPDCPVAQRDVALVNPSYRSRHRARLRWWTRSESEQQP